MIADYKTLKKHCNTPYSMSIKLKDGGIKEREFKVGDLYDNQLDIAKQKLERKSKLNERETEQLEAVKYVIDYRSKCALEGLEAQIQSRYIDKANRIANAATVHGTPIGIAIKTIDQLDFNGVLVKHTPRSEIKQPSVKIIKRLTNK